MGKKLYIGNLSYSIDENFLSNLFSQFGGIDSVKLITDRDSGRSKGFAFVEMSDENEANTAIEKLNGTAQEGRNITVSEAKPMQPREGGGRSGGFRGGDRSRGPRSGGGGGGGGFNRSRY